MADTQEMVLTEQWQQVAQGPCVLTLSPEAPDARWSARETAGAPADALRGHPLPLQKNTSMQVESGTRIYARGRPGVLSFTVDPI